MGRKENNSYDYDDPYDITESLKRQVNAHMENDKRDNNMNHTKNKSNTSSKKRKRKKKKRTGLKIFLSIFFLIGAFCIFLVATPYGRKILIKYAAEYISSGVNQEVTEEVEAITWTTGDVVGRKEEYVTNILLIGIEEFGGARNTDSMMIASINSRDRTVQLTSLMRDSYVNVPGWKKTKLNSAYAHGGIQLLKETIEENYMIHLDGFASVNFSAFEDIVDMLGGVEIQLGAKEAYYLNHTNYISNKANRNVVEGMNTLNGNQALGYCRIRKVPTYDGVNNDYGRTLRQRRVLSAIFDKYKSQNIFELISTTDKCMSYVTTSLSSKQIEKLLVDMVENQITTMNQVRIPVDDAYESPKYYEGVSWPIVLDWEKNIIELYKTIYGDTEEEAIANYQAMLNQ